MAHGVRCGGPVCQAAPRHTRSMSEPGSPRVILLWCGGPLQPGKPRTAHSSQQRTAPSLPSLRTRHTTPARGPLPANLRSAPPTEMQWPANIFAVYN